MKSMLTCRALGISAALAALNGCGSFPATPFAAQPATQADTRVHPDRSRSWMDPSARKNGLLYISDAGTGDVDVYSYPRGKLSGVLTGFTRPAGLCVDKQGDIFVTDLFAQQILEYPHGGTAPIETLADAREDPGDCAVNPANGDLAVTNVSTSYSGAGDVLIYHDGVKRPTKYEDKAIVYYDFCGYDKSGNLYVDGMSSGSFQLAELVAGGTSFTNITLDKPIAYAGAVQWDGTNLAIGDYEANRIYQFSILGAKGRKAGETDLRGASFAIGFWIQGRTVIGPNDDSKNVMFWKYPSGGSPAKTIGGLTNPWGATVSF